MALIYFVIQRTLGRENMDIESLLFNKHRLVIMVLLSKNKKMSYNSFKAAMEITDGNLASHLRKLEEAGLIRVDKSFEGRKPKTVYHITPKGEKELKKFLANLGNLLEEVRKNLNF